MTKFASGSGHLTLTLQNLVNFGPGVVLYHAATCVGPSLMHLVMPPYVI